MSSRPAWDNNFCGSTSTYISQNGPVPSEVIAQIIFQTGQLKDLEKCPRSIQKAVAALHLQAIRNSEDFPFLKKILDKVENQNASVIEDFCKVRSTALQLLKKGQYLLPQEQIVNMAEQRNASLHQLEALSVPISDARAVNLIEWFHNVIDFSPDNSQFKRQASQFMLDLDGIPYNPRALASQIRVWMRNNPQLLDQVTQLFGFNPIDDLNFFSWLPLPPEMLLFKQIDPESFSCLVEMAGEKGNIEFIEGLLTDPRCSGEHLGTTLVSMADAKDLEMTEKLVNHPLRDQISTWDLGNALNAAARKGYLDIIEKLRIHPGWNQISLLHLSLSLMSTASDGRLDIIEKLADHPHWDDIGAIWLGCLIATAAYGHLNILEKLATHPEWNQISLDNLGDAFVNAADIGRLDIIEKLKTHPRWDQITKYYLGNALNRAVTKGHLNVIEELMIHPHWNQISADVLIKTCLCAIRARHSNVIKKLVTNKHIAAELFKTGTKSILLVLTCCLASSFFWTIFLPQE
jgi:hypothetical protein